VNIVLPYILQCCNKLLMIMSNDASFILYDKFVASTRKLIVSVELPNVSCGSLIDQNHSRYSVRKTWVVGMSVRKINHNIVFWFVPQRVLKFKIENMYIVFKYLRFFVTKLLFQHNHNYTVKYHNNYLLIKYYLYRLPLAWVLIRRRCTILRNELLL